VRPQNNIPRINPARSPWKFFTILLTFSYILVFVLSRLLVLFKGMFELIAFDNTLWLVDIFHGLLEGIQEGKTLRTSVIILRCVALRTVPLVWKK